MQRYNSCGAVRLKWQFAGRNSFGHEQSYVRDFPMLRRIWGWAWAVPGQWPYIRPTFHQVPDADRLMTAMISSAVWCAVAVPIRNLSAVIGSCGSEGAAWCCCNCNDSLYVQVVCWWCPLYVVVIVPLWWCDLCSDRFWTCRSHTWPFTSPPSFSSPWFQRRWLHYVDVICQPPSFSSPWFQRRW